MSVVIVLSQKWLHIKKLRKNIYNVISSLNNKTADMFFKVKMKSTILLHLMDCFHNPFQIKIVSKIFKFYIFWVTIKNKMLCFKNLHIALSMAANQGRFTMVFEIVNATINLCIQVFSKW